MPTSSPLLKSVAAISLVLALLSLVVSLTGNIAVAESAQTNCQDIEKLNARVRENARKTYAAAVIEADESVANLEENAALLGIVVTTALRERITVDAEKDKAAALIERDEALTQYAEIECPFLFWTR